MRRFGLLGFLVLLLLVGAVGAVSYNLGVSAGATDAAIAEGASVIYAPAAGFSPFALILGLFFMVMLIGLVARALAGPRMAMGPGPWRHRGHGGWAARSHDEAAAAFGPSFACRHGGVHAEPPEGEDEPVAPGPRRSAAQPPATGQSAP